MYNFSLSYIIAFYGVSNMYIGEELLFYVEVQWERRKWKNFFYGIYDTLASAIEKFDDDGFGKRLR